MTKVVNWQALVLRDSDGYEVRGERKIAALREFLKTEAIADHFFDRLNLTHENREDVSTWGPASPDDVDWTGFPQ